MLDRTEGQLRDVVIQAFVTESENELAPVKLVTTTPFRVTELICAKKVPTSKTSENGPAWKVPKAPPVAVIVEKLLT